MYLWHLHHLLFVYTLKIKKKKMLSVWIACLCITGTYYFGSTHYKITWKRCHQIVIIDNPAFFLPLVNHYTQLIKHSLVITSVHCQKIASFNELHHLRQNTPSSHIWQFNDLTIVSFAGTVPCSDTSADIAFW